MKQLIFTFVSIVLLVSFVFVSCSKSKQGPTGSSDSPPVKTKHIIGYEWKVSVSIFYKVTYTATGGDTVVADSVSGYREAELYSDNTFKLTVEGASRFGSSLYLKATVYIDGIQYDTKSISFLVRTAQERRTLEITGTLK
ncbi:MAG: hypothetical protein ABIJ81_00305 [Patescibacteria group bacterium]